MNSQNYSLLTLLSQCCVICDLDCYQGNPIKCYIIVETRMGENLRHATLLDALASALGIQFNRHKIHSTILCFKCHNKLLQWEQLEDKAEDKRQWLLNAYRTTRKKYNIRIESEKMEENEGNENGGGHCNMIDEMQNGVLTNATIVDDGSREILLQIPDGNRFNICRSHGHRNITNGLAEQAQERPKCQIIKDFRPHMCVMCGKRFVRRSDLLNHVRTHTGERPFKCDLCEMAFTQHTNMISHKRLVHMLMKPYKCMMCSQSFKQNRQLELHMCPSQTARRAHHCETCGSSFATSSRLKKHRIIHTGLRPHMCEICGREFNSASNRNTHRYTHSEKKKYGCMVCAEKFMRKMQLQRHWKQTQHCNATFITNYWEQDRFVEKSVQNNFGVVLCNLDEDNTQNNTSDVLEDLIEEIFEVE